MATLTIRNVPDHVRDALRVRAARMGRSMEAEARLVLAESANEHAAMPRSEALERVSAARALIARHARPDDQSVDAFLAQRKEIWGET